MVTDNSRGQAIPFVKFWTLDRRMNADLHSMSPCLTEIRPPLPERRLARAAKYRVRLASSSSDIRAAQWLRFMVFNLELKEGLESSYDTMLDADRFDPVCDHLLVEEVATGELVGTYRLQSGERASRHFGYYSEQEFDFAPYESIRSQLVELGRACVHRDHRTFSVLNLLWKGIIDYATSQGARWLIGCSSITSQNPADGWAAYESMAGHRAAPEFSTKTQPGWECPGGFIQGTSTKIPKLLSAYLSLGARICAPPALDREFGTIDFLTLCDLQSDQLRRYQAS
jgi:putative hemolysin